MYLLHNIGERRNSNYNTRQEIQAAKGPLSFDGVYRNVWENRDILKGRDVTLFVTGKYIGGDNSFDAPMPLEQFCTIEQLDELVDMGCKLGYHSWSHQDLSLLSEPRLTAEVLFPGNLPNRLFAYPYGKFNAKVIEAVKKAGYIEAWGVFDGDNSQYQRTRRYLNW